MEIFREKRSKELVCRTLCFSSVASRLHWHENIEICQIKSAKCSFIIDGKRIDAKKDDLIFIGEYVTHRFIANNEPAEVRICQFPLNLLLDSRSTVKPIKIHIPAEETEAHEDLNKKIDFIFDVMEDEGYYKKSSDNPFFAHLAASLYFLLMKYFPSEERDLISKKDRTEFYKITEYINNNFREDLTIASVAKELCLSRTRLSQIFNKFAETSVNTYINTLRINYANELIETGKNITEAAYESGFQSIRTFNEVYKKITGTTPSQYIKKDV